MPVFFYSVVGMFGLVVGSFLNAVIYRLHSRQSLLEAHSRCVHCGHKLAPRDLIPVVSFFILRRRCRYCHKPISWQYPLVEITTAAAFVMIFNFSARGGSLPGWQAGALGGQFWFQTVFICFLIVIFVYDLKHYLILDRILLPACILVIIYQSWQRQFVPALYGALLLAGFFGLLYLVSKGRWIGAGDVKLGFFLGLLVPFPQTLVVFFLAYFLGAIVSGFLLLLRTKKLTDRLPFGTFLTAAAFLAMLWGEKIINWYFRLIGLG